MKKLFSFVLLAIILGCSGGQDKANVNQNSDQYEMPARREFQLPEKPPIKGIYTSKMGTYVGKWELHEFCTEQHGSEGRHEVVAVIEFKDNGQFSMNFKTYQQDTLLGDVTRMGFWSLVEAKPNPYVSMAAIYEETQYHRSEILDPRASLKTLFFIYPGSKDEAQFMDEGKRIYEFFREGARKKLERR